MLPRNRQVPRASLPDIGRYPCQGGVSRHLEGRSPSFLAPTGPCARPTPSRRLRSLPWSAGLCRLLSAPAGGWPFPTLSLRVFPWMQGPVPRRLAGCLYPFLPLRLRPSLRLNQVGAHNIRSAISERVFLSRLQSFANVPASRFACHPDRSYRPSSESWRAAVAFSSEQNTCRYRSRASDMLAA